MTMDIGEVEHSSVLFESIASRRDVEKDDTHEKERCHNHTAEKYNNTTKCMGLQRQCVREKEGEALPTSLCEHTPLTQYLLREHTNKPHQSPSWGH